MWGNEFSALLLLLILMFRRCIWQIKLFCGFSSSFGCLAGVQHVRLVDLSRRRVRCPHSASVSLGRGRGRMRVAITFRDQPEHERRDYEYGYSSLCRSEAESLPYFFEFEMSALFNQVANLSSPFENCVDPFCSSPSRFEATRALHS